MSSIISESGNREVLLCEAIDSKCIKCRAILGFCKKQSPIRLKAIDLLVLRAVET